ncbi:MAG: rod-binding protein, partial [Pseudomonadota bacterium]
MKPTHFHAFTDLDRFQTLRGNLNQSAENAAPKLAQEFEALFIEMMLASARKASIGSELFDSHATELYREMFDAQAARILATKGALGFEQLI